MWGIVLVVVLLTSSIPGCIDDSPVDRITGLPVLLIDLPEIENVTRIYVHGFSDTRYDALEITIDNETTFMNETYLFSAETNLTRFNLSIKAYGPKHFYHLELTVLSRVSEDIALQVRLKKKATDILWKELPYKRRVDKI